MLFRSEVIQASSGRNFATEVRLPRILEGDYQDGALSTALMMKDLDVYAALAARTLRSLRRIEPDATESALRRRAVRGLALALPFAIAALIAAFRDTAGESAESGFYRIFFVIVPCSLIAGWFASGAIAPGIAWLRTRRSGERTPN